MKTNNFEHFDYTQLKTAFQDIIAKGGPDHTDYTKVDALVEALQHNVRTGRVQEQQLEEILNTCGFLQDEKSIIGHIRLKPFGYAGDFKIIERIYQQDSDPGIFEKWDHYSLNSPAAKAVRNRKDYFKRTMSSLIDTTHESLTLLNIASGPARDLKELYDQLGESCRLKTTCVEMDKQAVEYARNLTSRYSEQIEFICENIFKFKSANTFDVIWSAGLFDYFNDKAFVRILSRIKEWIHPGGQIIIGNFSQKHNPTRVYMELFGQWYLQHRSEEQLLRLAIEAGFDQRQVWIGKEEEGINLFLHIVNTEPIG